MPASEALTGNPDIARSISARTLDGNDNQLENTHGVRPPRASEDEKIARQRQWLDVYLAHIREFLRERFAACYDLSAIEVQLRSVSRCETYWELDTPDAVAWASDAISYVATGPVESVEKVHHDRLHNCRSIVAQTGNKTEIAIYAKTSRLVRFEVRHKGRMKQTAKKDAACTNREVNDTLMGLSFDAHSRMKFLWDDIVAAVPCQSATTELVDLIMKLASVPQDILKRDLVALLLTNGAVERTQDGGLMTDEGMAALKAAGLTGRAKAYPRHTPRARLKPVYFAVVKAIQASVAQSHQNDGE